MVSDFTLEIALVTIGAALAFCFLEFYFYRKDEKKFKDFIDERKRKNIAKNV